jgi:hypothetical protein
VYGLESATSPEELVQVALDFYSKLHRRRPVLASAQDEMLREVREFPPGAADIANGELGPEETAVALRGMSNGTAPGLDGLPCSRVL